MHKPNIIIPKFKDVHVDTKMHVRGHWKVQVVHPNGQVSSPLGDKMRPNRITDVGLLLLGGFEHLAPGITDGTPFGCGTTRYVRLARSIADVISAAHYSSNSTNPTSTNIYRATLGSDGGYSSKTTTNNCTQVANTNGDGVIITKTYDFNANPGAQQNINEISIGSMYSGNLTAEEAVYGTAGSGLPPEGYVVFSRFVLPETVVLGTYQFLRLTYTLEVSIPAIKTPVEVPDISSGGFSALGKLKMVGPLSSIFGSITSSGGTTYDTYRDAANNIQYRRWPWMFSGYQKDSSQPRATMAALLSAADANGTDGLFFEDLNDGDIVSIPYTKTLTAPILSSDLGGENGYISYTPGSNSATVWSAVFFPATIPNFSTYTCGMFVSVIKYNVNYRTYNGVFDNVNNNSAVTNYRSGWLYNFYTPLGARRAQLKDINYALKFWFSQTITR